MPLPKNPSSSPRRLLAAALLAALSVPVCAESLKDVFEAARGYDATYLAARATAESVRHKAAQADALERPTVGLQAGLTHNGSDTPLFNTRSYNTASLGVQASQPLFNRQNALSIDKARKALDIAQADLATAEMDLAIRVAQAYFDVLAAQDALSTARASKTAISEQLASAKRNFEVGTATITDTREAQARFDLATASELAAENDLRTKRIALDQLVGRTAVAPKQLVVPVVLPTVLPADAEVWVTTADQQHPTIRRARVALDVAQLETAKARAGEKFTLDAVGSVGATYTSGSLASTPGTSKNASVGLQFNLPLYTGGATQNRIKETLVLEEKSRQDLEAARRGVTQGTRVAFFGVQSLLAQVKALEAAEASGKLALEATQLGYRVGVRVNLDVLNAQRDLYQTQRDLAKARYDVLVNGLRLRQASGQLAPSDLDAVNALLAK